VDTRPVDAWASGDAYERYVGRWSRPVAEQFLKWLNVPPGASWLDVGCGTGALCESIARTASPARVVGIDPSLPYLQQAQRLVGSGGGRFAAGRAERLPIESHTFDAVVSALALNFVPMPESAVHEMVRGARRLVAAYVWDYAEGMQMMRYFWDAVVSLDPEAEPLDEGRRFPLCRHDRLDALFRQARLVAVETQAIDIPTRFADFDDYWSPFLGRQGPAPSYVGKLSDEHRQRLRDTIRRALPVATDGSIALTARAWAVRGIKEDM
jgi:SAM-dependent methyltransferase